MIEPITIRYGAGINTVLIGDRLFDRNTLDKYQDGVLRRGLVDALVVAGAVSSGHRRPHHRPRHRQRAQAVHT